MTAAVPRASGEHIVNVLRGAGEEQPPWRVPSCFLFSCHLNNCHLLAVFFGKRIRSLGFTGSAISKRICSAQKSKIDSEGKGTGGVYL